MERHQRLSDREFEEQFATAKLPPSYFTHEAHLRLAWIHIHQYGIDKAVEEIPRQIRSYAESLGVFDKFNMTVTVAAVKAVYHFYLQSEKDNFSSFIKAYPQLKTQFKEVLAQHYQVDIYRNPEAKANFLEPDLLPFD